MKLLERLTSGLKRIPLFIGLFVFYVYGLLWLLKPREVESAQDILKVFYYDFLRLREEHVEVVKMTNRELVTISRNPCPVLRLSLALGVDTRYSCRLVSESVCRYVLKRINPRIVFERDYSYIRPYRDGCLERVYIEE